MRSRLLAIGVALTAAVGLASWSSLGSVAAARTSKITFKVATIGSQDGGGEPNLGINKDGTIYMSAPGNKMEFYASKDHGATWAPPGPSPNEPSVGDTSVSFDSSGAIYQSNLRAIETSQDMLQADIFKSTDGGKTWPQKGKNFIGGNNSSGNPFLVDRQWTDQFIPKGMTTNQARVYLTYHDFGPSQLWVSTSKDGGKNFGAPVDAITDPVAEADSYCNTIPGGIKTVPLGMPHAGRVYVAWEAADPLNPGTGCNLTQLAGFHSIWIGWSDDEGATWTDQLIYDGGVGHDASEIFTDVTLDNRGNPYVAFTMNINSEYDVWVEASYDGGRTWNGKTDGTGAPYKVNANHGTFYFPAIAAGNPGQVDVAYLGTSTVVPPAPNGKPTPGADSNAQWYTYVAQSKNLKTGHPTWKNVQLTKTPMHVGDICTLGLFCAAVPNSNRDLLDFIDVAVDKAGFFHVAWTDDAAAHAFVSGNQVSGPNVGRGGH